ncbi:hypothetical protein M5K25_017013 [Dendrobium thyrsiflorum]|uniref:Uncharacterized protein n=1 Tax=Dendrobium thyrsiflorum TaxID=117978 RepID=A0ABD0UL75_DENTH
MGGADWFLVVCLVRFPYWLGRSFPAHSVPLSGFPVLHVQSLAFLFLACSGPWWLFRFLGGFIAGWFDSWTPTSSLKFLCFLDFFENVQVKLKLKLTVNLTRKFYFLDMIQFGISPEKVDQVQPNRPIPLPPPPPSPMPDKSTSTLDAEPTCDDLPGTSA